MIIIGHKQGSPEWRSERAGTITASALEKIITPAKLAPSKQLDGYINTLAAEWLAGQPLDPFGGTFWTERGSSFEAEARMAFSVATGLTLRTTGFIYQDEGGLVGASPDSLVLDHPDSIDDYVGILELKCPRLDTHIGYWRAREVPTEYRLQVQGQLFVTGLDRAWFQSYHPDGPELLLDVAPDPAVQDALSEHVPAAVERLLELRDELLAAGCTPRDPAEWVAEQAGVWEGAA